MPRSYRRGMAQEAPPAGRGPARGAAPAGARRPACEPVLVPRWVQLVLLPLAIAGAYLVLKAAGHVLLLFIIAGLIALFLNPLVTLVQRAAHPARRGGGDRDGRPSSRFAVGLGFVLADPVSNQASALQREIPGYVDDANSALADLQDWLDRRGSRTRDQAGGRDGAADDRRAAHRRRRRGRRASPATRCSGSSRRASR